MHFGSVCSGKSRTGRPAIDLLGQRFGRLLVVERVENDKRVDQEARQASAFRPGSSQDIQLCSWSSQCVDPATRRAGMLN